MFDYNRHFDKYCFENNLELKLSFDMPPGYETANGTFDVETKTVYINAEYLLYSIFLLRSSVTQ